MLLDGDAILAADDLPTEDVDVPEWGGTVRVRGLNGKERDEYFTSMAVQRGGRVVGTDTRDATVKLVIRCAIGEDGKPLFGQHHVDMLSQKSAAALSRVFEVAQRLSGLAEEPDETEKDSAPTLNGATTSPSLNALA